MLLPKDNPRTLFSCPYMIIKALAVVNPLITGVEMKFMMNPEKNEDEPKVGHEKKLSYT